MKMYQFMLVIVAMALIACGKNGHNESESQQFSLMEIKPRNITLKIPILPLFVVSRISVLFHESMGI